MIMIERYNLHNSMIHRIELEDDINDHLNDTQLVPFSFPPILICSNNMHLASVVSKLYPNITQNILLSFYGEPNINITVIYFEIYCGRNLDAVQLATKFYSTKGKKIMYYLTYFLALIAMNQLSVP